MKGILLFKDGREVPLDPQYVGSVRHHYTTRGPNGEYLDTVFVADEDDVKGVLRYREAETSDVTAEYMKARESIRRNTNRALRKGLGQD